MALSRILRVATLALGGMLLHAQDPTCPKWNYAPVNNNIARGLSFDFEPATAVNVKIAVKARVNGIAVKLTKEINGRAGRRFFAMETGDIDTLVIERIDIWMGEYSGTYDYPQTAKYYSLAQVEE